jgi:hypothetical protein
MAGDGAAVRTVAGQLELIRCRACESALQAVARRACAANDRSARSAGSPHVQAIIVATDQYAEAALGQSGVLFEQAL